MSISIKDKVALVTGANRGIGKAIVESFLNHGAKKVYLAVRNPESTQALEAQYGDRVVTIQADVSASDSIKRLADQTSDVEIVVNNAGILCLASPLDENVEEAFSKEVNVNVFGLLRIAQSFAEILERNKGALVQLNSIVSMKNFVGVSSYSASKAASYSFTQGLREELGEKGVAVLSVHPGPIATDMGTESGIENGAAASIVSEGIVKALAAGEFHLFPDKMAQQMGSAYQSFAENVILADFSV
ncbi:SDR family oxidoreductase [Lentisphaera profundi]|uniref:SDR family oxidoreductase n=1 Tax=Lentisphaera profundi TaxID=1658616 RepID=A0ABY7VPK1_9BACT|nr:SDR family oxidoreductase [Lentisphaera profundi]WDE95746.1 SDR family oxidoreductase [Lentisphaera profundi]